MYVSKQGRKDLRWEFLKESKKVKKKKEGFRPRKKPRNKGKAVTAKKKKKENTLSTTKKGKKSRTLPKKKKVTKISTKYFSFINSHLCKCGCDVGRDERAWED